MDLEIFDKKYEKAIWAGRTRNSQRRGMGGGIFADTNKMVVFLDQVPSDAIGKAWT